MALAAGTRLGPYEVLGPLGAGGMGEVYRARDPRLGREVAVKVLPTSAASDPDRLRRFEREARAVAALNHPGILTVFDVGTEGDGPYVVTELLEGETLRQLDLRRLPTQRQIIGLAAQAARALDAAHAKGIVHRDLKPSNLFVTTDGRVKILDFGLARLLAPPQGGETATESSPTHSGTVLGTVAYMSPEQARALPVDQRSDIFSFGVVFSELLSGKHPFHRSTTAATLAAILGEPPAGLASTSGLSPALVTVLGRCLAKDPNERFRSAHDLAIALDALLQGPAGDLPLEAVGERSPYPGLAAFTERDAAVFFGREAEVASLWSKLRGEGRLFALIGPSGAGKTSFVRAGVASARPAGWAAVVLTPGEAPLRSLGQSLAPSLSADPAALRMLVDAGEPETAFQLVRRWRSAQAEALVVVDQLEELFTLCPANAQAAFAALLGRLAREADVHVLLSMRDDFLIRCCEHAALAPVLSRLTALLPLVGSDLRRALVEPAERRGYRLEDDGLPDDMVRALGGARAPLPLLAFSVARLWEHRDRARKLLTRAAYEAGGGVEGALAQHAEATLDRIGPEGQGVAREMFRNLVTAQGTRASVERDELLSAFSGRAGAASVLEALVEARLLTSYEVPGPEGRDGRTRVEVAHESLLTAWPRLVRWRTQDEQGAHLRDQLKQAAHLWNEKSRPPDLLWTATSYREFELWRERYPGQLTAVEENFARAMVARAERSRRLRRAVVAAVVVGLGAVAVAIGVSRQQAVSAARRAEASRLVALGRTELERYPAAALAYARRSLEVADTVEGRRFAVEALWRSPTPHILPVDPICWRVAWSPDGRMLAAYTFSDTVLLFHEDGRPPTRIGGFSTPTAPPRILFRPDGAALLTWEHGTPYVRMVSIPDGRELRRFVAPEKPGGGPVQLAGFTPRPAGLEIGRMQGKPGDYRVEIGLVPYDGGPVKWLGAYRGALASTDEAGRRLALRRGDRVYLRPLVADEKMPERELVRLPAQAGGFALSRSGDWLLVREPPGRLTLWPTDGAGPPRVLSFEDPDGQCPPSLDAAETRLAWGSSTARTVAVWDLAGPPDAAPRLLRRADAAATKQAVFSPGDRWLAVANEESLALWDVSQPWARVLRGHRNLVFSLAFTPDAKWLVSCGYDGTRRWPLENATGRGGLIPVVSPPITACSTIAVTPDGRQVLRAYVDATVAPLDGEGKGRVLVPGAQPAREVLIGALDPTGTRAAVATSGYNRPPLKKRLRILDVASGEELRSLSLVPEGEVDSAPDWGLRNVAFAPGGRVLGAGRRGIRRFDLEAGSTEWLWRTDPRTTAVMAASGDRRRVVAAGMPDVSPQAPWAAPVLVDPETKAATPIRGYGDRVRALALDAAGAVLVTGDEEGLVRVGRLEGGEPHLLYGHSERVEFVALSPDGRWIASAAGGEIRLWPMPDLSQPPLHTLPLQALVAKLGGLTNLRLVEDAAAGTGIRLEAGPFPGWGNAPAR